MSNTNKTSNNQPKGIAGRKSLAIPFSIVMVCLAFLGGIQGCGGATSSQPQRFTCNACNGSGETFQACYRSRCGQECDLCRGLGSFRAQCTLCQGNGFYYPKEASR